MDAPKRADVNRAGGDGTGSGTEDSQGRASAFRRALDAQVEVGGAGQALVPTGPHDLTVSIDRARILESLAEADSPPSDAGEPGAKDPRTRMPPWSPSVHWVDAAAAGKAANTAAHGDGSGAAAASNTASISTALIGVEAHLARPPQGAPAARPGPASRGGSRSTPSANRGEREKSRRLWQASVATAALTIAAAIAFVLMNGESKPNFVPASLPTGPIMSEPAVPPSGSLSSAKGAASPSAKVSGSATASAKASSAATGADATATAMATGKATSNAGTATVSASAGSTSTGATAAGLASANTVAGSALANASTGNCLNTSGSTYSAGDVEEAATCSGSALQAWTLTSSSQLTQDAGSYCLDDYNWGKSPGSAVDLWPCNGGSNQQWTIRSDGSIVSDYSDLCVSLSGQGTVVELERCDHQSSQHWSWS